LGYVAELNTRMRGPQDKEISVALDS
jgi:hypothetical protein